MVGTAQDRYYSLPVQLLSEPEGVLVRRGQMRLRVRGSAAGAIVLHVIDLCSRPVGATLDEILEPLAEELADPVRDLVEKFKRRRLLVPMGDSLPPRSDPETREDVFFWSFDAKRDEVEQSLGSRRLAIIGVNAVSMEMLRALSSLGFGELTAVDHPRFRSMRFFDSAGRLDSSKWALADPVPFDDWVDADDLPDCLVVTSDFGGLANMREWNAFCLREGVSFFPVVLQDLVGFAGPLVVPGITSCFECFWMRQLSNIEERTERTHEEAAFEGQDVDAFIGPLAGAIGNAGAFELFRFYSKSVPGYRVGTVTELDLTAQTMQSRQILRVPRCAACGTGQRHGRVAIERAEMPGNQWSGDGAAEQ